MKELKKSKRVTFAPGANLCQVKVFLSEDCPSNVCLETLHSHNSKTSNSNVRSFAKFPAWYIDPSRDRHHVDLSKGQLSCIPQIKWKSPAEFALDTNWCVASGEESEEVKVQNDRGTKVLEAIYPCLSSIPPRPSITLDEEDQSYDDSHTPQIPVIPIEEAAAEAFLPSDATAPPVLPEKTLPPAISQGPLASASPNISQCTMNSLPPPLTLGLSTSKDLSITSQPLSVLQGQFICATTSLPQYRMNSQLPSHSLHPSTCAAPNICLLLMKPPPPSLSRCPSSATPPVSLHTLKLQPPSLSQRPSLSATPDISQRTRMSLPPSVFRSRSTSGTTCIPQHAMTSFSQVPSTFAPTGVNRWAMNSHPPSLSQGQSTSTMLYATHRNNPESRTPQASEKPFMFDGLDSSVVDAVTAAATEIAKSKEQGSLIDTDLLIKLLRDPKMIEHSMKEHELGSNTAKTASGSNPGPSLVSLLSSMPGFLIKEATNEWKEPVNNQTQAMSRPVIASQSLPLPRTRTEAVAGKSVEEHGTEVISRPVSWRQSLPLHSTKPEALPAKVIEDHVGAHLESDTNSTARPVVAPCFPNPKTEAVPSKLIERHAVSSTTYGSQSISWPVMPSQFFTFPSSRPEVVGNRSIEEQGGPFVAPAIYGTKPMAKPASLLMSKPEVSPGKTFSNQYTIPAHAGITHTTGTKPVTPLIPMAKADVEKIKKLINEYGAPDNARQKSLPNGTQNIEMIKKMINEYGPPENPWQKSLSVSDLESLPFSKPKSNMIMSLGEKSYIQSNTLQHNIPRISLSPTVINTPPFSSLTTPSPPLKDINYYKSLIEQHGEKRKTLDHNHSLYFKPHNPLRGLEPIHNLKPIDDNARHKKPCLYFHSSRGCRRGLNCPYMHDDTSKLSRAGSGVETPATKRIKLVGNS